MKREKGAITIEATIVVVFTMLTIMVLLDFGYYTYNKMIVTKTANEVAADVASVYGRPRSEPFVGYVAMSDFYYRNMYRHLTLFGESKHRKKFKEKARWYACYKIQKEELVPSSSDFTDVKAELSDEGELGRLQLKVTIKRKYNVFSVAVFKLFGMKTEYTCEGVGYADCMDLIDYINIQGMKKELIEKYLSTINDELQKIINTVENFKKVFE